jgi:hypothetical protein
MFSLKPMLGHFRMALMDNNGDFAYNVYIYIYFRKRERETERTNKQEQFKSTPSAPSI